MSGFFFSYGAITAAELAEVLGHDVESWAARADGYRIAFRGCSTRWRGGLATLVPEPGAWAFGYVVRVTASDLAVLDAECDGLRRIVVPVASALGDLVDAGAYVSRSAEFRPPSRVCLEAIAAIVSDYWGTVRWWEIPVR